MCRRSAAAIVVEPVTGLEYPFRYDPKCFSLLKGLVLDMPTVNFCSLLLIALIAEMFPVPGYTLD